MPPIARPDDALPLSVEALAIAQAIDWRSGEAWVLWSGAMGRGAAGDYGRAIADGRRALAIAQEIDHAQWIVAARCMLGKIWTDLFALPAARRELEAALDLAREIASLYWTRSAAGWLASAAVVAGDLTGADAVLAAALPPDAPMDTVATRLLWGARAELALATGDPAATLDIAERLIATVPGPGGRPVARLEKLRGDALAAQDRLVNAEIALLAAREAAAARGARPLLWRCELALGQLWQRRGRKAEAAGAFAASRELVEGLAANVPNDTIRSGFLAAASALAPHPRSSGAPGVGGLTEREREVATLLTQGKTNREIAAALFISEWTAATHVRNILAKLDCSSRTQAAAWAVAHGLGDRS